MKAKDRPLPPLPAEFPSEDQAAEFWDTHSLADYADTLEPADVELDLRRRHFEIEVDEESFLALRSFAQKRHAPVKQLASEILKQKLTPV
jgi:hypothetical protein